VPGNDSLPEWMSDAEYQWRTRLKSVNLVIETDFTAEEIRTAQTRYGNAVRWLRSRGFEHRDIIKKYPAVTLTTLVGHAALAYDQGRYWESFWEELDLRRDADFEQVLRRSIIGLLDKFSLARFPDIERDSARKYVMLLTLHASIPVHCLSDLLGIINEHIAHGREARGAALMAWLDEPGKGYRADALDVPVRNFLMYGAEFAVDILDRIIEFVEATMDHPNLLEAELDSSTTGLPSVLLEELVQQLRTTPMRWGRRRSLDGATVRRPSIAYNVEDDEVAVALPYPSVQAEVPWRVSFDGEVHEIHCARKWGAGSDMSPTYTPIPGPVREVVVSHRPSDTATTLAIVGKSDPLLTFSDNGRWIPRRDGLKDAVWVIYPRDHQLIDPSTGKTVDERDTGSPAGWHGWQSAFVELDTVGSLQLRRDGQLVGTVRQVRRDARPRFKLGDPIPGLVSPDGRPVYGARPWVILPPSLINPPPSWRVRVRRVGETEWIANEAWAAAEVEASLDPFDDADEPLLGLFEVVVTGPIGADTRCVVFVAETLWAEFDCTIRVPVAGGLTACTAQIVADGLAVTPAGQIQLGTTDLEKEVELSVGEAATSVVVRPPHVEIRSGDVGSPATWRITPDTCAPEDFVRDRFVALRAPGVDAAEFAFVSAVDKRVQFDGHPRRKHGGVFELRTQRFADTVRAYETGRIVASLRTDDGPIEFTVLSVRPKQIGSGVALRNGVLEFEGAPDTDDLAAYVWTATAPWRTVQTLPVVDGAARLPRELVAAGELRCELFIDDPWVALELPTQPAENAFRVGQPGWNRTGTDAQVKLSRFIAGEGPAPYAVGAITEIWAALSWLHADGEVHRASMLSKLLVDEPRKALEGLGNSTVALRDKMAMLIRSELVNRNYRSSVTLNELHADPWFGCVVEMSDLPSLYRRRHEVPRERAETLGYLSDKGGELLIELLGSGKTEALHEGCFGRNVFVLSSMPEDQVEAIVRELKLVPGPLLHSDTRFTATYEAFRQRNEWMRTGWSASFAAQTSFVLEPIRRASALAYEAIKIRSDRLQGVDTTEHPWALMSLQSLTLAFLARLEAHGRLSGQYLNSGLLMAWTRFAQLCPRMVATDLLIAEALTLYDLRGDVIGAPA